MGVLGIGKLDSDVLQRIVIDRIRYRRPEVRTRAGIGEDCAVVNFGDYDCVISTDPITADVKDIGRLSIHISCNDIASNGIQPLAITLAVMLPEGTTTEDVEQIMTQAGEAAERAGVEIVGGHTEVTRSVRQPVIVSTAFGRAVSGTSASARDMRPGDRILMTKYAGLEGTGIIAADLGRQLEGVLSEAEREEARALLDQVSVVKEGVIAGEIGTAGMHDVTEGGIFGAVWEMCHISRLGARLDVDRIPVLPVTRKICDAFGIDCMRLISSGCMLMAAPADKAAEITRRVTAAGILITDVGEVLAPGTAVTGTSGGRTFTIDPPGADELYKAVH
ncbi:hydrogenase expression/formation protein HypE [Eubacterium pyruvativorans]|uniref:Hydrogenase expression/formation protein HypE n=1 Tax=Eubacterium pyruvativorans TaxID=155865 RepID=A0A1I7GS92_9FIRM|nr:AIR synthase family protein [Eubacterium pyruvativorans]SFO15482.1 hydrogenase expression/formation protein HypE [Eubacterium pyruvativorans]SFU51307.1 hydrogenase expression/formation protein HypE [Eubacterium pyruvativorans]